MVAVRVGVLLLDASMPTWLTAVMNAAMNRIGMMICLID